MKKLDWVTANAIAMEAMETLKTSKVKLEIEDVDRIRAKILTRAVLCETKNIFASYASPFAVELIMMWRYSYAMGQQSATLEPIGKGAYRCATVLTTVRHDNPMINYYYEVALMFMRSTELEYHTSLASVYMRSRSPHYMFKLTHLKYDETNKRLSSVWNGDMSYFNSTYTKLGCCIRYAELAESLVVDNDPGSVWRMEISRWLSLLYSTSGRSKCAIKVINRLIAQFGEHAELTADLNCARDWPYSQLFRLRTCYGCIKTIGVDEKPIICRKCNEMCFCDIACHTMFWKEHDAECGETITTATSTDATITDATTTTFDATANQNNKEMLRKMMKQSKKRMEKLRGRERLMNQFLSDDNYDNNAVVDFGKLQSELQSMVVANKGAAFTQQQRNACVETVTKALASGKKKK